MSNAPDMLVAILVAAASLLGLIVVGVILAGSARDWRVGLRQRRVHSPVGAAERGRRLADPTRLAALSPAPPRREAPRAARAQRSPQRPLPGPAARHAAP